MRMNKIKISTALLSILLISMMFAFVSKADAQTGSVSIQFRGGVVGECFAGVAEARPGDGPGSFEWFGNGRGNAMINGRAEVVHYGDFSILGSLYVSESLDAHGTVSFMWTEEDGSRHLIQAILFSDASTVGYFAPAVDCFAVTAGGGAPEQPPPLRFEGVHMVTKAGHAGRISLEGAAWFVAVPPGLPSDPHYQFFRVVQVFLLDETSQKFYIATWVAEEGSWPIFGYGGPGGGPLIPIPAARTLQTEVKITSWDPDYYFKASFKASTKGDCVVVCNARETTSDYLTLGGGEFSFQGKAVAELSQYSLPPDSIPLYDVVAGTMEASGEFQASWADNEGNPYELQIRMSPSLSYPYSQLEPNLDYMIFSAMILSQGLRMPFDYTGTLKCGSETFNIQGKCGFMVVPVTYFTPPGNVNPPDSNELFFYVQTFWGGKSNGYHFAWADKDTHAILGGYDLHLPAAKIFRHEVTFSNL